MGGRMKLIAYRLDGHALDIRPASVDRDWMDATHERFAYRCLPLAIANAHGWEIGCPMGMTVSWTGGDAADSIVVRPDDPARDPMAVGHFGYGVLTFHIPCLFRTEPGFDLWVQGPVNAPKDGAFALTGVVETDWSPYTFTMNWMLTEPDLEVRFEAGEPICQIFPVRRRELEQFAPELRDLSEAPELQAQYDAWRASRSGFNADLKEEGSEARAQRWQKAYYRGVDANGAAGVDDHRTRIRLAPFKPR